MKVLKEYIGSDKMLFSYVKNSKVEGEYECLKQLPGMPNNIYMTLSANRGMSEYGILTLGGFAVDPGYSGRLMFGLFNLTIPAQISLLFRVKS